MPGTANDNKPRIPPNPYNIANGLIAFSGLVLFFTGSMWAIISYDLPTPVKVALYGIWLCLLAATITSIKSPRGTVIKYPSGKEIRHEN